MKTFIVTLFLILLFVNGYISDDGVGMFSHIVTGFFFSYAVYIIVGLICYMLDEDGVIFHWVVGILNVLLIFDVYILLFLK